MAKIYRDINNPIEIEVLKQNAQLGNVPNVTTNNQTPTWSMSDSLTNIVSGETLTVIMGKISKAINDIIAHIGNKSNPHNLTKAQIGLGNVENKSGSTIRSELTKSEVTNALGYTPPVMDTKYSVATDTSLGLIKSGNDITVDSNGNVSVNNNSHNHIVSNIEGLQNSLDSKEPSFSKHTAFNKDFETIASNIKPNGTQSVGTLSTIARSDHVHPLQTSVIGNAGTATKLATPRKIAGTLFDGTEDISINYNNLTNKPTIPSGVEVIDNLTSSSTTSSLSANQGKILKEYLDRKIEVSSSQPNNQQIGDVWYEII